MTAAKSPSRTDVPRQPSAAMQRHAEQRDDDRADVAAGDVRGDREPAAVGRELLGEEAVADRVLRRAADARQDVGHGERQEAGGERLGDEPAPEQQAAAAEQPAARDDPGQLRVAELDESRRQVADRRKERDRVDAHPVLVDQLQEDQRQDDRVGVVDRVGRREQHERAHRSHVGQGWRSRRPSF